MARSSWILVALALTALAVLPPTPSSAATATWDGGSTVDSNWTTPENWVGDVAPFPGDALIFPDGAARRTTFNDFPPGSSFASLTFSGTNGGYTLGGNGIVLEGDLSTSHISGVHTVALPITLNVNRTVVVSGADLALSGGVGGVGGPIKAGPGTLVLSGNNTYAGPTTIGQGSLRLGSVGAVPDSSAVSVSPGASLNLNGFDETIGSLAGGVAWSWVRGP